MALVHQPGRDPNKDGIHQYLHLRVDLPSTKNPESQVLRSFEVVYSIPIGGDTRKLINNKVQYQYILTKAACVIKSTSENEVAEITNTEPLAIAYPTKKAWVTSELEFDYTALRVIRLENSPSLFHGPRAFVDPESIQAIVCHHAGISYSQLEQAANTWNSFPAITHNVYVGLLDKEFDLVLPVSFNGEVVTEEKEKVQFNDAGVQTKVPRSDFEASAFMAFMPTWAHKIIKKANPEELARRMLPAEVFSPGARFVVACFWAFLCAIDDITEDGECADCIDTCMDVFASANTLRELSLRVKNIWSRDEAENPKLKDTKIVITAFHHAICTTQLFPDDQTENKDWKLHFWHEVGIVVKALQEEKPLHGRNFAMSEWMRLRILTISARPFMVMARAGLLLPTSLSDTTGVSSRISQMQVLVQSVLGLQNDLLGWQKDHVEGNPMCCVEILIRDGKGLEEAFAESTDAHNEIVRALLAYAELGGSLNGASGGWSMYVRVLVSFCDAMAMWMMVSKRYCHRDNALPVKTNAAISNVDVLEKKYGSIVEITEVASVTDSEEKQDDVAKNDGGARVHFADNKPEETVNGISIGFDDKLKDPITNILTGFVDKIQVKTKDLIKNNEIPVVS